MPARVVRPHIDTWLLRLSQIESLTDQELLNGCSPAERQRAQGIRTTARGDHTKRASPRRQFLAGRWLARRLVKNTLQQATSTSPPTINIAAQGKPEVISHPKAKLTISHSGDHVIASCGLLTDADIGVDIEVLQERDTIALAEQFFHPEEQRWLKQQVNHTPLFYRLWTAKEAYLKAGGGDDLLSTLQRLYFINSTPPEAYSHLPGYLYQSEIDSNPISLCLLGDYSTPPSNLVLDYIEQRQLPVSTLRLLPTTPCNY
ncbi:phosphopantetheinyl transferase [Sinobacterium caligoides]|uniref:Phosphopantetheinyl transferase n=1 Tax=Sinobacterium caligoides TaxID=933926 RepID=A0A3N2DP57_9GAMM|nr:4'-phosphopantetheinyl transferase superfamily protein [Sinobacterium caligoides]ROS01594.1 phosphopantetheinyl transferase [Sinobacterium caligoides]